MGYILPIHQYQSNQYQRRAPRRKSKTVERPYKVILDNKHQDVQEQYNRYYRGEPFKGAEKGKFINQKG